MSERDKELSLVQHLGELRSRLMVASIDVVITTVIAFVFSVDIIRFLMVPAGVSRLIALSPTENFTTFMRVSLFSGIALAMPVILYEIYMYIDPALHPHERRLSPRPPARLPLSLLRRLAVSHLSLFPPFPLVSHILAPRGVQEPLPPP